MVLVSCRCSFMYVCTLCNNTYMYMYICVYCVLCTHTTCTVEIVYMYLLPNELFMTIYAFCTHTEAVNMCAC